MVNLLGDLWARGEPDWEAALGRDPGVKVHLYGKRTPKPGRKMGHLTVLDHDPDRASTGRRGEEGADGADPRATDDARGQGARSSRPVATLGSRVRVDLRRTTVSAGDFGRVAPCGSRSRPGCSSWASRPPLASVAVEAAGRLADARRVREAGSSGCENQGRGAGRLAGTGGRAASWSRWRGRRRSGGRRGSRARGWPSSWRSTRVRA